MPLTPGSSVGTYEVVAQIGVGGMGEVYRARDTRLKRDVALKILPALVAADPDRVARFEREARILAALNHPHIAALLGFEQSDGVSALVMELVEGPTLADRVSQGPIPLDEALPIATQIAEALEAAHEQGIIHRDLKPANIKVKDDGTVKVLDFGLAKALEPASANGAAAGAQSMSPTLTSPAMTNAGIILGTAPYMSPEQARGRPVDKRTDVWAFGCVLYEMLTGTRAFDGEDATEIIAAIVKTTPNWAALPADTPAPIVTAIQRCLEKDRRARISDLAVARFLLSEGPALSQTMSAGVAATPTAPLTRRRTTPLVIAALLVGAAASALGTWLLMRPARVSSPVERYVITTPPDAPASMTGNASSVWISPDGSRIVYRTGVTSQRTPLWSRERDSLEPRVIPGTEGGYDVFFSPDGQWMGFFDSTDSTLKRVPTLGGLPQTICAVKAPGDPDGPVSGVYGRGASWGADGQIVFATANSKGLMRVPAAGGKPEILTKIDTSQEVTDYFWPEVLPDGRGVLVTAWNRTAERSRIVVVSPDGRVSTLVESGTYPRYAPGGHLLFALGGTLRAVRFDATRLAIAGSPVPVLEDVAMTALGAAHYAIGGDGTLVYGKGPNSNLQAPVPPRTLVWVDRQGRQEPISAPPRAYTYARLSPDGTRVALDARDQQNDIWIWDLTRETLQRLTTDPGLDRSPVWTPDGTRVAFSSARDGKADGIFWRRADGSGQAERIDTGSRDQSPKSFPPDGKRLVFQTPQTAPYDLGVLDLGAPPREQMLIQSAFNESNGELSPDGRWLAYDSSESGRLEIYVSPFPEVATSKQLVSPGGGTRPLWSRDGRELFYYVEPGTIMAVPVTLGASFSFGKSVVAIKGPFARPLNSGRHYDVSPDGKRFLLLKDVETATTETPTTPVQPEIRIVLHFGDELDRPLGKN